MYYVSLSVLISLLLYVAGIIAQFLININKWKAAGSDYHVSPGLPSLHIIDAFTALFHFPEGLIALIPMTNGRKFSVRVIRPYFLVAQIYSLRNTSAIASVFPA